MKKINRLFVFTGFLIGIIFFGCDNSFTNKTNEIEYGQVTISVSEKDNMQRTIFPQKIDLSTTRGLIFKLTGTLSNTGTPYTKIWEDITTEETTTYAYNSMIATKDILLQTGTWSFTLTVSRTNDSNTEEFIFTSSITQEIQSGENILDFTLSEATSEDGNVANGNISIDITFPNTASVSSVTGTLTNMVGDSNSVTDSTEITPTGSLSDISLTTDNTNSHVYYNKNVEPGNYLLVFSFYQNKDNDNKIIKTWTSIVKVAPGATSSSKIEIDNFNTIYTLTLDYGYAKDETDKTNTTQNVSFNSLTTITLPTPARDGYTFGGWYKEESDDNGNFVYGENAGESFVGGDYNADTILYAKWIDNNAITNWTDLKKVVESFVNISDSGIIGFSSDFSGEATESINVCSNIIIQNNNDNITIKRASDYLDTFFNVESGSLTLDGVKGKIILDGGALASDENSSISATSPLISAKGSLILSKTTLQNNINTSSNNFGGGIYFAGDILVLDNYSVVACNSVTENKETNGANIYIESGSFDISKGSTVSIYGNGTFDSYKFSYDSYNIYNKAGTVSLFGQSLSSDSGTNETIALLSFVSDGNEYWASTKTGSSSLVMYPGTYLIKGDLTFSDDLDIYGNVIIYSQNNSSIAFEDNYVYLGNGDFTIRSDEQITITPPSSTYCFYAADTYSGMLTIENCVFGSNEDKTTINWPILYYSDCSTTYETKGINVKNCSFTNFSCDYQLIQLNGYSGKVLFEDCSFNSNTNSNENLFGTIYLESSATFRNCTFTDNSSVKGGGIYITNGNPNGDTASILTLEGCTFDGNSAVSLSDDKKSYYDYNLGGAIYAENANVIVNPYSITSDDTTTIQYNSFINNVAYNGGGIYIQSGNLAINGGIFNNNNSAENNNLGTDIYIDTSASLSLEGLLQCTEEGTPTTPSIDLYLASNEEVIKVGDIAEGSSTILVSLPDYIGGRKLLDPLSDTINLENEKNFFNLNETTGLTISNDGTILAIASDWENLKTLVENVTGTTYSNIYIDSDLTANSTIGVKGLVHLIPYNKDIVITRDSSFIDGALFETQYDSETYYSGNLYLAYDSDGTLTPNSITLDGASVSATSPLINIAKGYLYIGNAILQNNINTSGPGAINAIGSLYMYGGKITRNTGNSAGAIYAQPEIFLYGGEIAGNTGTSIDGIYFDNANNKYINISFDGNILVSDSIYLTPATDTNYFVPIQFWNLTNENFGLNITLSDYTKSSYVVTGSKESLTEELLNKININPFTAEDGSKTNYKLNLDSETSTSDNYGVLALDETTSGDSGESGETGTVVEGAYYVSATGNDSNNGLSYDTPFNNLNDAIAAANNSESKTVYVIGSLTNEDASYSAFYLDSAYGTSDNYIQIIGYPDSNATLTQTGSRRVLYISEDAYIKFKDLTITGGNSGTQSGAAVNFYSGGHIIFDNCNINNNTSTSTLVGEYTHDGIYVAGGGIVEFINSTINNNIVANSSGSKIIIGDNCNISSLVCLNDKDSSINIGGSCNLSNNIYILGTNDSGTIPTNSIFIASTLTNHSSNNKITICFEDYNGAINGKYKVISLLDESDASVILADEIENFTLADSSYKLTDDGYVTTATSGETGSDTSSTTLTGTEVTSYEDFTTALADTSINTIIITNDFEMGVTQYIERDITIAANSDVTLTSPNDDILFYVYGNCNFTLGGGSGMLTIMPSEGFGNETPIFNPIGTLNLKNNLTLTGFSTNEDASYKGVVYIDGGTLNMEGGIITDNTTNAITGYGSVRLNISGGEISSNTVSNETIGSAIYIEESQSTASINIAGDAKIYNNSNELGSTIYIAGDSSKLNINSSDGTKNAAIYNNTNSSNGGNIYFAIENGTLIINEETITVNPYTYDINAPTT